MRGNHIKCVEVLLGILHSYKSNSSEFCLNPLLIYYQLLISNSLIYSALANGADMTIESDSGYSPMALAVAFGHKKSMCCLCLHEKSVWLVQNMFCWTKYVLLLFQFRKCWRTIFWISTNRQSNTSQKERNGGKDSETVHLTSPTSRRQWEDLCHYDKLLWDQYTWRHLSQLPLLFSSPFIPSVCTTMQKTFLQTSINI